MSLKIRIIGIDPSLRACGWGVIEAEGSKLRHIGHGVIKPKPSESLPFRLNVIFDALSVIIADFEPQGAGVEEAFMKDNAMSALKLGQARAACVLAATQGGLSVGEYSPRTVKKSVVGTGAADKAQVAMMINTLMPSANVKAGDAADALAIAVCHAHNAKAQTLTQTLKSRLAS